MLRDIPRKLLWFSLGKLLLTLSGYLYLYSISRGLEPLILLGLVLWGYYKVFTLTLKIRNISSKQYEVRNAYSEMLEVTIKTLQLLYWVSIVLIFYLTYKTLR